MRYQPTLEEIKEALSKPREILKQIFPVVRDIDVAKFRELLKQRLEEYYKIHNNKQ